MEIIISIRGVNLRVGTFIEADKKSGFDEWVDFTAKIIEDLTKKE